MKNSFIFLETIENKFTIGYLVPFQRPSSHIWIQMRHQRTTLRTTSSYIWIHTNEENYNTIVYYFFLYKFRDKFEQTIEIQINIK